MKTQEQKELVEDSVEQVQKKRVSPRKPKKSDPEIKDEVNIPKESKESEEQKKLQRERKIRADVYSEVIKLHKILTNNAPIEEKSEPYSKTEVVQKTTLSHSKAQQILDIFAMYNFIQWIKPKTIFKFTIQKKEIITAIQAELTSSFLMFTNILERFKIELEAKEFEVEGGKISFEKTIKGLIKYLEEEIS